MSLDPETSQAVVDCLGGAFQITLPRDDGASRQIIKRLRQALRAGIGDPRSIPGLAFTRRAEEQLRAALAPGASASLRETTLATFLALCEFIVCNSLSAILLCA